MAEVERMSATVEAPGDASLQDEDPEFGWRLLCIFKQLARQCWVYIAKHEAEILNEIGWTAPRAADLAALKHALRTWLDSSHGMRERSLVQARGLLSLLIDAEIRRRSVEREMEQ